MRRVLPGPRLEQCRFTGKTIYRTAEHAQAEIDSRKDVTVTLQYYLCEACNSYHLTSINPKKKKPTTEELERQHFPEKFR